MKPSEIIDVALTEVIPTETDWCQNTLRSPAGRHCLLGALAEAHLGSARVHWRDWLTEGQAAREAVLTAIQEQPHCAIDSLITFNDAHGRSYEQVRAVLEKARAGLQEQGQ